jgi:hypothetical protein
MALAGLSMIVALGLAACSMPVKILEAEIPPEQSTLRRQADKLLAGASSVS